MTGVWRPGLGLALAAILALSAYLVLDLWIFPLETRFDDEGRFVSEAIAFARTGEFWVWDHRALEMPLTGLIYGVIYKIVGTEPGLVATARALQALLLVIQAWLCADLAQRLFQKRLAASLAFAGVLAYPMLVAFQAFLLSEAIFIFLLVLGMWCLYRWAEAPAENRWLLAYALSMAAATYAKASLTFLPVILPVLLLRWPIHWREAARVVLLVALVYAACLGPWWIRNARLFGEPVWFTTSSAAQLYLGNNPANQSGGNDWGSDVEQPFVSDIHRLPELERDRRYRERAMAYIKAEPLQFVRNAWGKFVRYWNIVPNHEMYRQGAYPWIIGLSYGPALILALIGVWVYRTRWRLALPIYALVAYFTLLHSVTIASLRYRLPLEPFLIVFAAGALASVCGGRRPAPPVAAA
jgi:4-amino-4-deoxy-L-arabinose transferase-like glycosyltransferase